MKVMAPLLLGLMLAGVACTGTAAEPKNSTLFIKDSKDGTCSATTVYLGKQRPARSNIILTAAHCLKDAEIVRLQYHDGDTSKVASVKQLDIVTNDRDQALVRINYSLPSPVAISNRKLKQRDKVKWWGNPQDYYSIYREGYVAAVNPDDAAHYFVIPAVSFGDSGAGIFSEKNQLVAVVSEVLCLRTFCATLSRGIEFTPEQVTDVMED